MECWVDSLTREDCKMADEQVALLFFITIAWAFSRQTILKYKPIPKWLDISIALVCVIFTIYAAYDTFIN